MSPSPRITIGPASAPRSIREAVVAGGGELVDPDRAEGVIWVSPMDVDGLRAFLAQAPNARWVQLPYAGVETFAAAGVLTADLTWAAAKGVYAEPVAEHALALALACLRQLPTYARATGWGRQAGRNLYDARVTVLGGGGITEALLPLLAPFRCEVTVVRRSDQPMAGAARTLVPSAVAVSGASRRGGVANAEEGAA